MYVWICYTHQCLFCYGSLRTADVYCSLSVCVALIVPRRKTVSGGGVPAKPSPSASSTPRTSPQPTVHQSPSSRLTTPDRDMGLGLHSPVLQHGTTTGAAAAPVSSQIHQDHARYDSDESSDDSDDEDAGGNKNPAASTSTLSDSMDDASAALPVILPVDASAVSEV